MVHLTDADVLTIQKFLVRAGFQCTGPSTLWTAQAQEAYKHFQIDKGVPHPKCALLPTTVNDLHKDLRVLFIAESTVESPSTPENTENNSDSDTENLDDSGSKTEDSSTEEKQNTEETSPIAKSVLVSAQPTVKASESTLRFSKRK